MSAALSPPTRDSSFACTRWTVVRQAADWQTVSEHLLGAPSELSADLGHREDAIRDLRLDKIIAQAAQPIKLE